MAYTRTHECPAYGCTEKVPSDQGWIFCRAHWAALPEWMRKRVKQAQRRRDSISGTGTTAAVNAALASSKQVGQAIAWLNIQEQRRKG